MMERSLRLAPHVIPAVAGMYNSEGTEGYRPIMRMLRRNGCALNFTCAEMLDDEQPRSAKCSPQKLLQQVRRSGNEKRPWLRCRAGALQLRRGARGGG